MCDQRRSGFRQMATDFNAPVGIPATDCDWPKSPDVKLTEAANIREPG